MARIIYIEDEMDIGQWVTGILKANGYDVTWLISGEEADRYIMEADVIILDVMLPGLDGFSIGKRIKEARKDLPVLMLSARTAIEDKIEGLQFADDYVTKPFHPEELTARIEVLLRRFNKQDEDLLLQHLTVNTRDLQIINNETKRDSTDREAIPDLQLLPSSPESDSNERAAV